MIVKLYKLQNVLASTYNQEQYVIGDISHILDVISKFLDKSQIYIKVAPVFRNFPPDNMYLAYISNWGISGNTRCLCIGGKNFSSFMDLANYKLPKFGTTAYISPCLVFPAYMIIKEIR